MKTIKHMMPNIYNGTRRDEANQRVERSQASLKTWHVNQISHIYSIVPYYSRSAHVPEMIKQIILYIYIRQHISGNNYEPTH